MTSRVAVFRVAKKRLEREPRTKLDFAAWSHRHRNDTELRRVHKSVGRAQVHLIQGIKGLSAEKKAYFLCKRESSFERQIQCLQWWSVYGISPHVAKAKRSGRGKRCGIEPLRCSPCPGAKNRLPRVVGADRVLPQHSPGVSGVPKYRNGERHSGLRLIDRGKVPIRRDDSCPCHGPQCRDVVDAAQRKPVPHVAPRPLLRSEVRGILWDRRFVHWGTEVRRIRQVFRKRVIRQQA